MSHEITNIDKQQGLKQAWHKLTEVCANGIKLAASWLAQWDVVKSPLFTIDQNGQPIETEYCQLVATDNPKIHIGAPVHKQTYQPISNKAFLDICQDALNGIRGAEVASVGSVCGRGRVFVSVQLQELPFYKAAGRTFQPYLNFLNSHDQSAPFGVTTSNVCTVCNNTFGMNLCLIEKQKSGIGAASREMARTGAVRIRLKHTKNVADRLENVGELIDGFLGAQAEFRQIMDKLNSEDLDIRSVKPLFTGFLTIPDIGATRDLAKVTKAELELSTRRANQIDRITELHFKGNGNLGKTMADAFSAVTDYYTHESSSKDNMSRQFESSEFGAGQSAKTRAWHSFQNPEEVNRMIAVGHAVLAAN